MPDSWLYFGRLLLALIGQRELKTVGATDGDTLGVELTCDYLFGVFMSHTLHTAGNMADVGMLFSFLFHFVVGFTNSITLAVRRSALAYWKDDVFMCVLACMHARARGHVRAWKV